MTMLLVPGDVQLSNDKAERAAKPLPAYLAEMPRLKLEMLPRFLRKLFVVDGEVDDDVAADFEDAALLMRKVGANKQEQPNLLLMTLLPTHQAQNAIVGRNMRWYGFSARAFTDLHAARMR